MDPESSPIWLFLKWILYFCFIFVECELQECIHNRKKKIDAQSALVEFIYRFYLEWSYGKAVCLPLCAVYSGGTAVAFLPLAWGFPHSTQHVGHEKADLHLLALIAGFIVLCSCRLTMNPLWYCAGECYENNKKKGLFLLLRDLLGQTFQYS